MMAVALDDAKTAMAMIHEVDSMGSGAVSTGGSIWKESIAEAAGPPDNVAVTVAGRALSVGVAAGL